MENNFNGYNMNLPKQNFQRRDSFNNNVNPNVNFNNNNNNNQSFTSLDGRKWQTKDQEIRANQQYYIKMLNDSMKKQ